MDTTRHSICHRFSTALAFLALTAAAAAPRAALAQYAATVLADKPVAYYRFDETAGPTALNSAATGAIADGIIHAANAQSLAFRKSGALPVADPASAAFGFNNAFVTIPRLVQDDFTIEFFFRTTAPGPGNGLGQFFSGTGLINGDVPDARDDFGTSFSAGHVLFGVGNASGHDLTIRTPGGLNDGKWHLVDAVRTRATGSIELFIDGQSVTSATGGTQSLNAAADLQIGKIASDYGPTPSAANPFNGDLDEVALYPTALTAERIARHYAAATTTVPPGTTAAVTGASSVYNGEPGGLRVILAHKLVGHSDYVNSVAFSPDSHTIVSGARDKTVRLWDVATAMQKAILGKHDNFVSSVAFSPDGRSVASGGWDNKIKEFDIASGQEVSESKFDKHQSYVLSLAYGPRGRRLASGSNDRTARTFSRATGASEASATLPDAVASVAFSPNSEHLAGACLDGSVYVWDAATLKLLHHLVPAAKPAASQFAVVFLDDDTLAAGGKDGVVHVWTVHDESPLANLTTGGHEVYGLAYDAVHRVLAGGGTDHIIRLWAAHNIRLAKGGNVAPATTAAGHRNTVRALAFSSDGSLLASGSWDFDIDLWHLSTRDALDRVIIDPLDNLDHAYRHSDGWSIDAANPADFGNDASRLRRSGDTTENLIYHATDLKSFSARVYFQAGTVGNATPGVTPPDAPAPFDVASRVRVSASPDNVTYKPVPYTHDTLTPNDVTSGWLRTTLKSALPVGTNYLKIEFAGDPAPSSPELSEVRLVGAGS